MIVPQSHTPVGNYEAFVARGDARRRIADLLTEKRPDVPRRARMAFADYVSALNEDDRLRFEAEVRARAARLRYMPRLNTRQMLAEMRSERVKDQVREWATAIGYGALALVIISGLIALSEVMR